MFYCRNASRGSLVTIDIGSLNNEEEDEIRNALQKLINKEEIGRFKFTLKNFQFKKVSGKL